jgi:hypothetical protein
LSFLNASKFAGRPSSLAANPPWPLKMADHPTDDDREDDAHDRKPKTGSTSVPPKRITNRELWTPPIDHNGPSATSLKLYETQADLPAFVGKHRVDHVPGSV